MVLQEASVVVGFMWPHYTAPDSLLLPLVVIPVTQPFNAVTLSVLLLDCWPGDDDVSSPGL